MEIVPGTNKPSHVHPSYEENFKRWINDLQNFKFPTFKHEQHGPVVNVNKVVDQQLTMGQKIADGVASAVGSWPFIIIQSCILLTWILLNIVLPLANKWDPYPFILLNLALSFQAAYAAPFVMMSQNRQASKDRLTAENDYKTDVKGEEEICHIMEHLDHQDEMILKIVAHVEEQNKRINDQERLILELVQKLDQQHQQLYQQHEQYTHLIKETFASVTHSTVEEVN